MLYGFHARVGQQRSDKGQPIRLHMYSSSMTTENFITLKPFAVVPSYVQSKLTKIYFLSSYNFSSNMHKLPTSSEKLQSFETQQNLANHKFFCDWLTS